MYWIPPALGAALTLTLGMFVLLQRPRAELNQSFAAACFAITAWLGPYAIAYSTHDAQLALVCSRLACTSVVLYTLFLYHFTVALLELPAERFYLLANYAVSALLVWLFLTTNLFLAGTHHYFWGFYSKAGPLHPLAILLGFIVWFRCIYLLWHGYGTEEPGPRKQQIKYALISVLISMPATFDYIPKYGVEIYPFGFIGAILMVLVAGYGIVRYQFLNVRLILRRSLVYSLLIACLTAAYLLVVLITERWFQGFFGYRSFVATLVVAFLTAIFFNPLRERIQAFVDRAILKATPAELATQREQLLVEVRKGDQQKAVATLAAGLAHEIKNPLTSIKTFTEHLRTRQDDPMFMEKFQRIVGGEVERINLIVQQLLEFAKPSAPQLVKMQLPKLLDETIELLGNELTKHRVTIVREYPSEVLISGDPKQLKQVFLNLFLNSLQAMDGAGGKLTVAVRQTDGEVITTVSDTGCGIAPEDLPRLFTPFYTTKAKGTGLGLAVVQSIITEHGGTIRVASTVGRGTEMTVALRTTESQA